MSEAQKLNYLPSLLGTELLPGGIGSTSAAQRYQLAQAVEEMTTDGTVDSCTAKMMMLHRDRTGRATTILCSSPRPFATARILTRPPPS